MKTKEDLIRVFLLDGPPCNISYEYRKKRSGAVFKEDWPLLKQLIKEGLVVQWEKTNKRILFGYKFWNIVIGKNVILVFNSHGGSMQVKITKVVEDMSAWPILKFETEKHGICQLEAQTVYEFHKNKEVSNMHGRKYVLLD